MSDDLASRLRIKAGMIRMGEKIEWGSDVALMMEAADAIERRAAQPAVPEGFWLAPDLPTKAMLRPFYECPPEELEIAYLAMAHIALRAATITDTAKKEGECHCRKCATPEYQMTHFIACSTCGNKRCPHASDHLLACTGSNEPGQPGSVYSGPKAKE